MDKSYNPQEHEDKIYKLWEESGFFNPDNLDREKAESWSMVLPPPNVTGELHTGHALMLAIEDLMTRYHRMKGDETLWIPGTDHAAIATQSKVENKLYKEEKKTRHDLGREKFLEKVEKFAQESHDTIVNQIKKMGASLDWSREAHTLDKKREGAIYTTFKKMYDDGLIYRDYKVVNWDPKGQTTLSDDEVEHKERKTTLYTFKYSKDFPISIATTRPETKLGDVAVAVHPEDKRHKEHIGKEFKLNFVGKDLKIKIIADESIDPEFGTGAVGVTPAHSIIDWDIGQRHNLELKQVIDEDGKIINSGSNFNKKSTTEAREIIVEKLKEDNLLEKEEEIVHNIATSYRTGGLVEPLPKLQWFVDVNKKIKERGGKTLKELMVDVVKSDEIEIIPKRFEKTYFHWIDNLRDWNISRQIWYGHRIPVYYCSNKQELNKEFIVVEEKPNKCPICGECKIEQDPDTLDTWFSSGLWTFSTLGWPNKTKDLENFHPTNVLETGYDILFFWVARMILMSTYLLGEIPFKKVYLHGLIRDEKGRKMSKSLDNAIDPLDFIEEFGADALRMAMIVGNAPGTDTVLTKEKTKAYKHFANKIWNASRFTLMNLEDFDFEKEVRLSEKDEGYLKEFENFSSEVTDDIDNFRFHLASEKIYHYFWHTFADVIIEETKNRINGEDRKEKESAQAILYKILTNSLKILHPFMPFVTESIWQKLPHKEPSLLMIAEWPSSKE